MILLEVLLIMLHNPEGREVWISPAAVVLLHVKGSGEHYSKEAHCLINLDDGKFVAVRETCDEVRKKIGESK